jgi:hypothetical protein
MPAEPHQLEHRHRADGKAFQKTPADPTLYARIS